MQIIETILHKLSIFLQNTKKTLKFVLRDLPHIILFICGGSLYEIINAIYYIVEKNIIFNYLFIIILYKLIYLIFNSVLYFYKILLNKIKLTNFFYFNNLFLLNFIFINILLIFIIFWCFTFQYNFDIELYDFNTHNIEKNLSNKKEFFILLLGFNDFSIGGFDDDFTLIETDITPKVDKLTLYRLSRDTWADLYDHGTFGDDLEVFRQACRCIDRSFVNAPLRQRQIGACYPDVGTVLGTRYCNLAWKRRWRADADWWFYELARCRLPLEEDYGTFRLFFTAVEEVDPKHFFITGIPFESDYSDDVIVDETMDEAVKFYRSGKFYIP